MAKKKEPKSLYDIQSDFENMQRMSCVPIGIRKVRKDYVFDENQSVKWNKEQVEKNNLAYEKEVARLNTLKNKERDQILEDIYYTIQCEVGHNLSRENAIRLWDWSYELGHSDGIHCVISHLGDIITLVDKMLSGVK